MITLPTMNDEPKPPKMGEQIAMAVTIAALSALVSGLVSWGVDELRIKFGTKEPEKKP